MEALGEGTISYCLVKNIWKRQKNF